MDMSLAMRLSESVADIKAELKGLRVRQPATAVENISKASSLEPFSNNIRS
jgi:hypothetical protein